MTLFSSRKKKRGSKRDTVADYTGQLTDETSFFLKPYKRYQKTKTSEPRSFFLQVSGIVTCFMLHIRGRLFDVHFLQQLSQIGFLAHWESLLSTHGKRAVFFETSIRALIKYSISSFNYI